MLLPFTREDIPRSLTASMKPLSDFSAKRLSVSRGKLAISLKDTDSDEQLFGILSAVVGTVIKLSSSNVG